MIKSQIRLGIERYDNLLTALPGYCETNIILHIIYKELPIQESIGGSFNHKRQIITQSDAKLPQPFASWSNSL